MKNIGNTLKGIREEKSFSKEELSKDICSVEIIEDLERDNDIPTLSLLKKLCDRLSVTIDEVMELSENESDLQRTYLNKAEWFNILEHYMVTKQYAQLNKASLRVQSSISELSVSELQLLTYYRGIYELRGQQDVEKSNKLFVESLNYTYNDSSSNPTDIEVILLSLIGLNHHFQGDEKKAKELLTKSFDLYLKHHSFCPKNRIAQLYYVQAVYRIELGETEKAIDMIDAGLSWFRKTMTLYMFEDLLYLKAIALEDLNNIDDASFFVELADKLSVLEKSREVVNF